MEINAENMLFDRLNALVKASSDKKIIIRNVLGQRYIASGAENKEILIYGVAGNALGAYLSNTLVKVYGNAQDAAGDTMNTGSITVFGHTGDTIGYAMRGGELIVRDGCGWRGGINMKQYGEKRPVIVIGGDAGNFLGEYMAGGIIVLMGRAGDHLASGMHGGVIYLRRNNAPAVVPDGLDVGELTDDDSATLGALLARYDACFGTEPHEQASVDEFVALRPASSRPYAAMYAS